ncbi:MAG: protein kinase [Prevotella sp.]|nr:protein kinase [Prevotella sp.]MCM1075142.1 protein kinase [Ruminococcus sp.]
MAKRLQYVSKEEKKIAINDPSGKWSDMTLLPEWAEEYYDVFTAKKHGKWVMLKALKKEYADKPEFRTMLDREFETRYNLAHPNIVMINDYEDIPGVGSAIITDDVYGYSLRRLIEEKHLSPLIVQRLETQLLDALDYIQENHIVHRPVSPDNIIFTEYNENLKLINVGYDSKEELSEQDTLSDIKAYGEVLGEVLDHLPASMPRLRRIAADAENGKYKSVADLRLAIERRSSATIYICICIFIALMTAFLCWLAFKG